MSIFLVKHFLVYTQFKSTIFLAPTNTPCVQGPICECDNTGYKGIFCEQGNI